MHQHVAQSFPPEISDNCMETKEMVTGSETTNHSKTASNQPFTLHRIHTRINADEWRTKKHRGTEETEDLPSRSWRALRWRRWRGCHTRIWFWMNERGPLCSSEQTKTQAETNCTRREREKQRRVMRTDIWQACHVKGRFSLLVSHRCWKAAHIFRKQCIKNKKYFVLYFIWQTIITVIWVMRSSVTKHFM